MKPIRYLCLCLALLGLHGAYAETSTLVYEGIAYPLKPQGSQQADTLLYREQHVLTLTAEGAPLHRHVRYVDNNGQLVAEKHNRYGHNASTPEFTLVDQRTSYREQARRDNQQWWIGSGKDTDWQEKPLNQHDHALVIDAGFDEFVRLHWQALQQGQSVNFSFAVPARQDVVNFRIRRSEPNDAVLILEMRLRSRLIAWLLDPIELHYDLESQRLLRYRGLTNIQDEQGQGIYADIHYHYSD